MSFKKSKEDVEICVGDVIQCKGCSFKVNKIISQFVYQMDGKTHYDIEFYGEHNEYHYWKSYFDGGCVLRP